MKHLADFGIFESALSKYDAIMGKLLHLYGGIPVPKEKSSIVIGKITLAVNDGEFYPFGQDVDLKHVAPHDKVRFTDYFDSLLQFKDIRGFNFEGLLVGLFGGELERKRDSKYDIEINGQRLSIKFLDHSSKAPELGSYKSWENTSLGAEILEAGGLRDLFQGDDEELKADVFDTIVGSNIDGWVIAFPDKTTNPSAIICNYISKGNMKELLLEGYAVAPKAGIARGKFSLALSSNFKYEDDYVDTFKIILPKMTIRELEEIMRNEKEDIWAEKVFGEAGSKIRPDVLRFIYNNRKEIGKRLTKS